MRALVAAAITMTVALFTAGSIVRPEAPWGGPASSRLAKQAYQARDRGDLVLADSLLTQGAGMCMRARQPKAALRFRLAIAAARYSSGRFRAAGEAYLAAEQEAMRLGDLEALTAVRGNLASLYAFFGDRTSARRTAEQGIASTGARDLYAKPGMQLLLATLYLDDGDTGRAIALLRDVLRYPLLNDEVMRAAAWDTLGNALIAAGDLAGAESALVEALRVRRIGGAKAGAGVSSAYAHLANLRLAQGRPAEALRFADSAVAAGHPDIFPLYSPYYLRGNARRALGQPELALRDFGEALAFYTAWRTQALPADMLRAHSNAAMQRIYDAYIATAAELYARTGRQIYLRLAWEADEASRAVSLRESLGSKWRDRVEPEYWAKLARLRALMLRSRPAGEGELAALDSELVAMEARAGLGAAAAPTTPIDFRESIPSENTLLPLQRQLGPGRAVVSFRLGERASFRWTVTNREFHGIAIAPRSTINAMALRFEAAVRSGRSDDPSGAALYRALFSGLPREAESARAWLIEPDGELFKAPFSALPGSRGFLAELHAVSLAPGTWAIGSPRRADGPFAAIADPVYNSADPRLGARGFATILANVAGTAELPRLPATRVEAAACARAYSAGNPMVLTGLDASRAGLARALAARPAVLHVAAHVAAGGLNAPVVVLSRGPDGAADGLTAQDIAALDVPGSLVVMSGCASGRANALPGDGLMGLGRAWLAAGARSVIATHWPVQDEAGALLSAFYREFRACGDASAALRLARIHMIRERGSRANPAYWAAYELMERGN